MLKNLDISVAGFMRMSLEEVGDHLLGTKRHKKTSRTTKNYFKQKPSEILPTANPVVVPMEPLPAAVPVSQPTRLVVPTSSENLINDTKKSSPVPSAFAAYQPHNPHITPHSSGHIGGEQSSSSYQILNNTTFRYPIQSPGIISWSPDPSQYRVYLIKYYKIREELLEKSKYDQWNLCRFMQIRIIQY